MANLVEVENLRAYYITQAYGVKRTVKAVDGITMSIREGEVYGIAGESGCGKSTLLRVLMAAHQPPLTVVEGTINYHFGDRTVDALHMTADEVRDLRWKEVSYVPQGSMTCPQPCAPDTGPIPRLHYCSSAMSASAKPPK